MTDGICVGLNVEWRVVQRDGVVFGVVVDALGVGVPACCSAVWAGTVLLGELIGVTTVACFPAFVAVAARDPWFVTD